jgi:Co-chaperonin GroES (HSP10)
MKKTNQKVKVVPVGDRVLLRPEREEMDRTIGRIKIVLPESVSKEKSDQGKVVAVGEGKKVKVGDTVIFSKYSYDEVNVNGEDLYLVKEENILAIIKS